jgi:hypothetical protein
MNLMVGKGTCVQMVRPEARLKLKEARPDLRVASQREGFHC